MNQAEIEDLLLGIPVSKVYCYQTVSSTNDLAIEWAGKGALDFTIVIADHQTRGRGRYGRSWFTPPGAALAFSLILRPREKYENIKPASCTALGAVAVSDVLGRYGLTPQIKWPNDVLLNRKKVCGILTEAQWVGDYLQALILGIGINIAPSSVPPKESLNYPATSVELELEKKVNRYQLLKDIISQVRTWREQINTPKFFAHWEQLLAFKMENVLVTNGEQTIEGTLVGLTPNGHLRLRLALGLEREIVAGEIKLRPAK
jgi:BirA family biotin operon repressor/biotin-[acetyl-CoA-carboxylase] ligase